MVKIYGRKCTANGYAIRDFLHRSDIPFEWVELTNDEDAASLARVQHLSDSRLPVCVFHDGTRLECPTIRQITEKLGWFANPSRSEYDLAIYGAGPAGPGAAGYGSSRGVETALGGSGGRRRGVVWLTGGVEERVGRAGGRRRPGLEQLENRELPRLSARHQRRRARRASARAGVQIRRRDPACPQGCARGDECRQAGRLPGGWHQDHRARRRMRRRGGVPPARGARRGAFPRRR